MKITAQDFWGEFPKDGIFGDICKVLYDNGKLGEFAACIVFCNPKSSDFMLYLRLSDSIENIIEEVGKRYNSMNEHDTDAAFQDGYEIVCDFLFKNRADTIETLVNDWVQ